MSAPERRFVEFRADGDAITGVVVRYGDTATFGQWSERFEPGALEYSDVVVNLQHDRGKPVARIGAGLTLSDSKAALEARIAAPDTVYGREAKELIGAGILRGLSMEFRAIEERMEDRTRIVSRAELVGIGIVDRPAYAESTIAARFAEIHGAPEQASRRSWNRRAL